MSMTDPAGRLANTEQRIGHPLAPGLLRRMAADAREEARLHEDAAGRAYNRADHYDDLATQRERAGAAT